MSISEQFAELKTELRRLDRIGSISAIMGWDEQVNLQPKSALLRGEQNAIFGEIFHREASSQKLGDQINTLYAALSELDPKAQIIVKEAKKDYDRLVKIPSEFVARKAKATSASYQAWIQARKNDDFKSFAPHLTQQLDFAKEEAHFLEADNAYDYWVDRFDPGMTANKIKSLFDPLEAELRPIVQAIVDSPIKAKTNIFKGFPVHEQEVFLREVAVAMGFDFERGRIDTAIHPFCGGHPQDTRMTTRYDVDNPLDSISSSMHETGHALYEQGLLDDLAGTALGDAVGMAVHESQSRMWENQIGRHRQFWNHFEPRYRELFNSQLKDVDSDTLYLAINKVEITPIRVDADEVTYNLHIMLRFHLEQALFNGNINPIDLPDAWDEASQRILGYRPKNNTEGCLQDVHWCEGLFGYFPSYCLGNMMAAQLWYTIKSQLPDIDAMIAKGDFAPILSWLRKNIHERGREFYTDELAQNITGKPLSHNYLIQYLRERYLPLYTVS